MLCSPSTNGRPYTPAPGYISISVLDYRDERHGTAHVPPSTLSSSQSLGNVPPHLHLKAAERRIKTFVTPENGGLDQWVRVLHCDRLPNADFQITPLWKPSCCRAIWTLSTKPNLLSFTPCLTRTVYNVPTEFFRRNLALIRCDDNPPILV